MKFLLSIWVIAQESGLFSKNSGLSFKLVFCSPDPTTNSKATNLNFHEFCFYWLKIQSGFIVSEWVVESNFKFTKHQKQFHEYFGPIVCQGKRVAAIFHLSTTTRAKQIESIVSRHCWNSFSHFIRFSLNWLKTCAKYFKMLQLAFTLLFIFSSRNSHLLKLVWNSYVYLWRNKI